MLVEIEFTMTAPSKIVINLKDYGYEADTRWEELSDEEQNEITDNLALQYDVLAGGEELDYETNHSQYEADYDEDEIKEIEDKLGL